MKVRNWLADGIGPNKLLYDKFKWLKKVEDINGGMEPERWLHEKSRVSKFRNTTIFSGIFSIN